MMQFIFLKDDLFSEIVVCNHLQPDFCKAAIRAFISS